MLAVAAAIEACAFERKPVTTPYSVFIRMLHRMLVIDTLAL